MVTAALKMPRDRIDVLDATVDFFIKTSSSSDDDEDSDFEAVSVSEGDASLDKELVEAEVCSPDVLQDFLGLRGCADLRYHLASDAQGNTAQVTKVDSRFNNNYSHF